MDSSHGDQAVACATTRTLVLMMSQGHALVCDMNDVEHAEVSTPHDVHELPPQPGDVAVRRKLGQAHVHLSLHFKPGKDARWVPIPEATDG